MKKLLPLGFAALAALQLIAIPSDACCAAGNAKWVRPEIGTAYNGHTFVAATYPFGLLQPGPDTGREGWQYCSGYRWDDARITGFSQTHLNGTGCPDLGDLRIMPFAGEAKPDVSSAYRKETQVAEPGYYAVTLDDCGVKLEATVSPRCAIYRLAYPKGEGRLLVDCQHGIGWDLATSIVSCDARAEGDRRIVGTTRRRGWVDRLYSYVIEFDRPFTACETLPKAADGEKAPRFALRFDLSDGTPLHVRIGYSTVDVDGARRNLAKEIQHFGFDGIRVAARAAWNHYLARADIDGTDEQKVSFYTALYHAFIQPNNIADVDGRYRGADGKVSVAESGEYYSTLSLWDTYRAANPLYTLIAPEKIDAMVATMVAHQRAAGFLPIWTLMGKDNQCMIGSHAVPVIVDAYLKGFRGFDPEAAYQAIRATLRERHADRVKENWDLLDAHGYYPNDIVKSESVARLLECAYDDWCAGVMAERLGHAEDAAFFRKRAGNWRNVLDPETGFMRGRDSKGTWRTPFSPFALGRRVSPQRLHGRQLLAVDVARDAGPRRTHRRAGRTRQGAGEIAGALRAAGEDRGLRLCPRRDRAHRPVRARQRAEPPRRLLLPVPRTRRPHGGARARDIRQVLPREAGRTLRQRRLRTDERLARLQRDGLLSVQPVRRRVRPRREQVREVRDVEWQADGRLQAPPRRHRRRRRTCV